MLQLLHMLDNWTECLECGRQIDAVYTDFEKAFDKVPHKRLLPKLYSYKINNNINNWIEVTSGILQGTVLANSFFIYVNVWTISLTVVNHIQIFINRRWC